MSYLGNSPQTVTTVDYYYTATAGQTAFSGPDTDGKTLAFELGNVDVIVNGFTLSKYDFVETTGTITLNDPRDAGDIVQVRAKGTYSSTDHYTKAESPALAANNTFTGTNTFEAISVSTVNGGALSGFRNILQNPIYQVDIEGRASGTTANNSHAVEGWKLEYVNGVTTQTLSRATGDSVPYSLKYTVTTGSDTSIAVGDYAAIVTAVEGYDFSHALQGTANAKSIWISGRVKAPTTATYCIAVKNAAKSRTYTFEVACTANTFVDFEKEIIGETNGTWENTDLVGLTVWFVIASGTTYQTTADAWQSNDYHATASQANGLATNGNVYEIENIRVSVGGPIPTEYRPYQVDLKHCMRYYEGSYDVGTTYATATTVGSVFAYPNGTVRYRADVSFKVPKRISPTIIIYSTFDGTSAKAYNASAATNIDFAVISTGENSILAEGSITVTVTDRIQFQWIANARLI